MKKFLMIASAAAMAVTMPSLASADKGGGQGKGQGGGKPAQAQNANGGGNGNGGGFKQAAKAQRQQEKAVGNGFKQAEKAQKQQFKAVERSAKAQNKAVERQNKAQAKQAQRAQQARLDNGRWDDKSSRNQKFGANGAACPPGLAKKSPACIPPGQARKLAVGQQLQSNRFPQYNLPQDYRNLYADNANTYYRYDENGYIYRVNRENDLVTGLIPLLGGGFSVGQVLPAGYDVYNVPLQYRDTYFDTDNLYYRFGDNAIYQVDPQTRMIQNVVALLTGDSFGIGQTLPAGYDMYNLPMQYRDQYYDTDQYNYRYADGNIYQIDPQTQIIQSIISALI